MKKYASFSHPINTVSASEIKIKNNVGFLGGSSVPIL